MESQGHYMETFSFLLVIHLCIDLFDFLLIVYCQHNYSLYFIHRQYTGLETDDVT